MWSSSLCARAQGQLIPNSAWKDYSTNTNYAFDAYNETEEKHKRNSSGNGRNSASNQQTLQMSHSPAKAHYYNTEATAPRAASRHQSAAADNDTNTSPTHRSQSSHYHVSGAGDLGRGYQSHQTGGDQQHVPRMSYNDRTYSLPRTVVQQQHQHQHQQHQPKQQGYYTQDRRNRSAQHSHQSPHYHQSGGGGMSSAGSAAGIDTPDFYFMPSQRKYSGEVVRVYVDYNKEPKN